MGLNLSDHQKTMLTHMGIRLDFLSATSAPDMGSCTDDPGAATPLGAPPNRATPAAHPPAVPAKAAVPDAVASAPAAAKPVVRTDVAQADWDQLQQAVRACTACALCQTRKQTVFGVGTPPSPDKRIDIMIVGEAPGEHEDAQGEPFVGAAGQLLDQMLTALGLSRQPEGGPAGQVFIANVLKCRPPGNRNPHADEVAQCLPFLQRQIEWVRPKLLLAMGRFGAQALLAPTLPHVEGTPLGKLRGQSHQYQGIPLVVTYHPAYLLRSPSEKGKVWTDLCLAQSLASGA
jgi:uracil-DNA glycosylase family 4